MEALFGFFMITAVTGIIAVVGMEFMNYLLKRRIIRSGKLDEQYLRLLTKQGNKVSSLKWGIIFLFGGIGLVVIGLLPFEAETSPIPWGVEVIFIGAGFLTYFLLIRKDKEI